MPAAPDEIDRRTMPAARAAGRPVARSPANRG